LQRRTVLKWLGAAALAPSVMARILSAADLPGRMHWTWSSVAAGDSTDDLKRRFAEIRAAGIGGVLLGGASANACRLAREEGLIVHAWTWTMCRGGDDLLQGHPDWFVVSRDGRSAADHPPYVPYYHFLCPSRPEVRQYLRREFASVAAIEGLTGVHLDYIRFPDVILPRALWEKYGLVQDEELPSFDFCYCEVCRERFRDLTGQDPLDLPDPPGDPDWRRFRWRAIDGVVEELCSVIRSAGLQSSAAVFPSPSIARRLVRQDWAGWPLDAVFPMVYHSFYEETPAWIEPTVREGVRALPPYRPLYAGLYLPALATEADFEQAVAGALAGGAQGVALFGGVRDLAGR